ncbi:MAG TPA: hypothetical protein VGG16_03765 [Streptosporangiaceae bacterium]
MKTIITGALLGLAALSVAACGSAASTTPAASTAPAASATTVAPATVSASSPASGPASGGSASAPPATASPTAPGASTQTAASTFIASGQDLRGAALYEPACGGYGCQLSGDSTAYLADMKWSSWTTVSAIGTGTYKLNTCSPNCAAGRVDSVPVTVTFSDPVRACVDSAVRWYWTKASFRYLKPLPSALQGQNAPVNPWVFSQLAQSAQQSCG